MAIDSQDNIHGRVNDRKNRESFLIWNFCVPHIVIQ